MSTSEAMLAEWTEYEADFARDGYIGTGPEPIEVIPATERPLLVLTAPHAVNHWRNDAIKLADRGTGSLVRTLARFLGCHGIIHARQLDPEQGLDDKVLFQAALLQTVHAGTVLVDFHGMRDQRDLDTEIGLGGEPDASSIVLARNILAEMQKCELRVACNEKYQATSPHSLTNWGRAQGLVAVQVELAARARPPLGAEETRAKVLRALTDVLASVIHPSQ